jgi:hypothetical protein
MNETYSHITNGLLNTITGPYYPTAAGEIAEFMEALNNNPNTLVIDCPNSTSELTVHHGRTYADTASTEHSIWKISYGLDLGISEQRATTSTKAYNTSTYSSANWYDRIERVIYTLKNVPKSKDDDASNVVLATVVYFTDGTRSVVKNSKLDKVGLIFHEDGTVTPNDDAKRIGLMYAVTKRMLGKFSSETGEMEGAGYMNKLAKIIKKGIDTNQSAVRKAKAKQEAKERHQKMVDEAKTRKEKEKSTSAKTKDAIYKFITKFMDSPDCPKA